MPHEHMTAMPCTMHTKPNFTNGLQVDLRSERSEDPDSLLVKDAELQVSQRQGSIAQASDETVD